MRCEDAKEVNTQCYTRPDLKALNEIIALQTEMIQALSGCSSNEDLCHTVSVYVPQLLNVQRFCFHHIEHHFSGIAEKVLSPDTSNQFPEAIKESLSEIVFQKGETLIINDLPSYKLADLSACIEVGITALMVTPVFAHINVAGIIILGRTIHNPFETADLNLLHQVSATLGLKLERNLLLKVQNDLLASTMETNRVSTMLNQMYEDLDEATSLERIYTLASNWISKILDCIYISISRFELSTNTVICSHHHSQKTDIRFDSAIRLTTSSFCELIVLRKSLTTHNLQESPYLDHQRLYKKLGAQSTLSTPLIVTGRMFGAVSISSMDSFAFGKKEEQLLSQIASHVSILIDNFNNKKSLEDHAKEVDRVNNKLNVTIHNMHERETELIHLLEANKELMSITSHDLKNPLGGILGLSDMIIEDLPELKGPVIEEVIENAHLIKQEAEHMMEIIKNLLDKHRKEVKHEFTLKETNVVELIQEVIHWNQSQATAKHIDIHFAHDDVTQFSVDAPSIQRAIDNYLSNAIKYSPQHSNVWIEIDSNSLDGSYWKISVKDEGPGLNEDDKLRVFRKMQRLSAQPTAGEHSTGLGLYIVKQIVEQHGGSVGVDSVFGSGATFWMLIPQHQKFIDILDLESAMLP